MKRSRREIIFYLEEIYVYEKKMFNDTDISVCTYLVNRDKKTSKEKEITFISNEKRHNTYKLTKEGELSSKWEDIQKTKNTMKISQGYIDTKIEEGNEKVKVLDTSYDIKEISISKEQKEKLEKNILILRTTDTGTKIGKLGLYTISEIWGEDKKECKGLITKISSRVYTQIFFREELNKEKQLKLKDNFNEKINELREEYNSIFLTNYKNSSNGEQRKRVSFDQVYKLINYLEKEKK